jgi:hypothetical protein
MNHLRNVFALGAVFSATLASAQLAPPVTSNPDVVLEPWSYTENFEDRELGAWASYPHWQDIAYNHGLSPK